MMTHKRRSGSTALLASLALSCVLLSTANASAQTVTADSRWTPWLGCWSPEAGLLSIDWNRSRHVCAVAATATAIDIVSIVDGKMQSRERIDADGRRHPVADCTGTYRAIWSASGRQVFVDEESSCAGRAAASISRVLAFNAAGHWLDVTSVEGGGGSGVHTVQYRPLYGVSPALPEGLAAELRSLSVGIERARSLASSPLKIADIAAVSHLASAPALQGWLVANSAGFDLNPKSLVALADAKVPDPVIDVMVALTFPDAFSVQAEQVGRRRAPVSARTGGGGGSYCEGAPLMPYLTSLDCAMLNIPLWSSLAGNYGVLCVPVSTASAGWLRCSRGFDGFAAEYGYANSLFLSPYPYGYRYYGASESFYVGQSPFVVVPGGSASPPPAPGAHGRVVNGRGYTQGGAESSGQPVAASSPASSPASPSSMPSSSGSESAPSPATPSSSGGERTAHPR